MAFELEVYYLLLRDFWFDYIDVNFFRKSVATKDCRESVELYHLC